MLKRFFRKDEKAVDDPKQDTPIDTPTAEATAPAEPGPVCGEEPAEADAQLAALQAENAALSAQVAQLTAALQESRERQMRQQADFENTRKRLRRDSEESGDRAIIRFVRPILIELDGFERALAAANPERFADFALGVTMIRDNLQKNLAAAGIEMVPAEGVFDPAVHEVIAEAEHADLPRGTIVQVCRAGYRLRQQVVRAAQVIVAKPPATPPAAEAPAEGPAPAAT